MNHSLSLVAVTGCYKISMKYVEARVGFCLFVCFVCLLVCFLVVVVVFFVCLFCSVLFSFFFNS